MTKVNDTDYSGLIYYIDYFINPPGEQYRDILEDVLLPSVRTTALPHPEVITLVQDNSPIHK